MTSKLKHTKRLKKRGDINVSFFLLSSNLILNYSSCIKNPEYSQYDCYDNEMEGRIKDELKCLWPFHIHNKPNLGKYICDNMTEFEGMGIQLSNVLVSMTSPRKNVFFFFPF